MLGLFARIQIQKIGGPSRSGHRCSVVLLGFEISGVGCSQSEHACSGLLLGFGFSREGVACDPSTDAQIVCSDSDSEDRGSLSIRASVLGFYARILI